MPALERASQPLVETSAADDTLRPGAAHVTGIVQDRDGGPIAAARVQALGASGLVAAVVSAVTDENGAFDLAADDGRLTLRVTAEGYAGTLHATTAPSRAIRIELSAASRLVGEVVSKTKALPTGIVVTATARDPVSFTGPASATTDDAGRFVIDGLSEGSYDVEARSGRFYGKLPNAVLLELGQTQRDLRLMLEPAVLVAGRVVVGAGKKPCAGAQLGLLGSAFRASAIADAAGGFRFEGVAPGALELSASCPPSAREPAASTAIEVRSEDLTGLELVLAAGVTLHGRVVDDRGQGIVDRDVVALALDSSGRAAGAKGRSADRGEFELTGLAPGDYRVMLEQQPEVNRSVSIAEAGPTPEVVLELAPSGSIRVELAGAAEGLGDDWVVSAQSSHLHRLAASRGGGVYELVDLAPGHYEISAYDSRGTPLTASYELQPDQIASVTLQVPVRTGQITGSISDASGMPVAEARVSAIATGGAPRGPNGSRFVLSAPDGSFLLDGLAEGASYDVEARSTLDGHGRLDAVSVGRHVRVTLASADAAPAPPVPPGLFTPQPGVGPFATVEGR
jgi:hypothetical protein